MAAPFELVHFFPSLQVYFSNESQLLDFISYAVCLCGIAALIALLFIDSPYGKHSSSSFGFLIAAKPAWILQEIPNVIVLCCLVWYSWPTILLNKPNAVLLTLFFGHYIQRTFIYPLLIRGGKPSPFLVFFLALVFCLINSYLQCQNLLLNPLPESQFLQLHYIIGCLLFLVGMFINLHSDHILRNLRKPGETGYRIPEGGMFDYVSAANMFGELVEWTGFAIASWSLPGFTFVFFTCCNLVPRAISHHNWYRTKFEDYPKTRTSIIPFLL